MPRRRGRRWPHPTNGFALASFLRSLVSCGHGSVLAIVFGVIARRQIAESGYTRALAGIMIGLAVIVLWIIHLTGNLSSSNGMSPSTFIRGDERGDTRRPGTDAHAEGRGEAKPICDAPSDRGATEDLPDVPPRPARDRRVRHV